MRSSTFLGTVESVTGATVTVGLDPSTMSGLVYVEGQGHRVGQVGGFVRIPQGFTDLFGIVTQAGVAAAPTPELALEAQGRRWLSVELVGEGKRGEPFSRGVFLYPTIGDRVHLVTEEDLSILFGGATSREHVEVGHLSSTRSIPARIDVNRLVTRHCAVVGATGSGKSTTVAGLLDRISDPTRFPAARVLILDLHGEYASAFGDRARVFRIAPDERRGDAPLHVPFWALTLDELLSVSFGQLDDMPRGRVMELVTDRKRRAASAMNSVPAELVTADTPLPFSLHQLWYDVKWEMEATYPRNADQVPANAQVVAHGSAADVVPATFEMNDGTKIVASRSTLNIRRQADALGSRLRDPRFAFLFRPGPYAPGLDGAVTTDLDVLLRDWLGTGGPDPRPISILDLSGIPTAVLTQLVGALLRLLFDALFWARDLAEGGRERPLLIVMEEAHAYLADSSGPAAQAVRRIVKEGRKYGIGAMLVSQRPVEIDSTILSQCGTFFALRMGNATDRAQVTNATTDSLKGLLDMLPALRTGEAIIVGEAVHLPTRAMIHRLPEGRRPDSDDPRVVEREFATGEPGPGGWDRPLEVSDYGDVVAAWRRQEARSGRLLSGS